MRKIVLFTIIPFIVSCSVDTEKKVKEKTNQKLFISNPFDKSLMPIGAYYYPEHWPKEQWERDIKNIADLGFEFTHFGEFAWAMMEPEEGKFRFGWLDTCVALADKYGLKVIMCTPTPTPPAWLTNDYPEVLLVNSEGIKQRHGTRLHINGMNPTYQRFAKRIVAKLAERYGNDDRIWGWQIDNEPHFGTLYDYSPTAQRRFRRWLKEKYQTVGRLNKAWGTPFWSQVYNNFDQIRIPNKNEACSGTNPHALLDFKRFTADEIEKFLAYQADILRNNIMPEQWITTNYAYYKFLPPVDPFRKPKNLDFASHTMYLLSTYLNYPKGELAHRLGSGMELSFSNELAKSVCGYTGIMELQPGQINWGNWNSRPLPGAVRMWVWHSFALGDEFICTYRFRQPRYGGEQFHEGIMETDGITVSHGGKEYVKAIKEIKNLEKNYQTVQEMPEDYSSRHTAFIWKQDNLWSMQSAKHNHNWNSWQHYYTYYENLKTIGAPVTFIQEKEQFEPEEYPFMVCPAYEMVDSGLVKRWKEYVKKGGHLILSCRTGLKNENGHLWEAMLQEPVWKLIGAKVNYYDQLPPSKHGKISMYGKIYKWNMWGDILEPYEDTKVWAVHKDQFYAGEPVVITRKLNKGTVTYIGAWSIDGELERSVIRKVYQQADATILDQERYVFTEWRDGFWVTVNYSSNDVEAPLAEHSEIIYGDKIVEPGDVCVWKNK